MRLFVGTDMLGELEILCRGFKIFVPEVWDMGRYIVLETPREIRWKVSVETVGVGEGRV